jgi:TusA-related sulfurtransferase
MDAEIEVNADGKTFATGLLLELIAALRRSQNGDLLAVVSCDAKLGVDLEAWCRFTRNSLVDVTNAAGRLRWVIR